MSRVTHKGRQPQQFPFPRTFAEQKVIDDFELLCMKDMEGMDAIAMFQQQQRQQPSSTPYVAQQQQQTMTSRATHSSANSNVINMNVNNNIAAIQDNGNIGFDKIIYNQDRNGDFGRASMYAKMNNMTPSSATQMLPSSAEMLAYMQQNGPMQQQQKNFFSPTSNVQNSTPGYTHKSINMHGKEATYGALDGKMGGYRSTPTPPTQQHQPQEEKPMFTRGINRSLFHNNVSEDGSVDNNPVQMQRQQFSSGGGGFMNKGMSIGSQYSTPYTAMMDSNGGQPLFPNSSMSSGSIYSSANTSNGSVAGGTNAFGNSGDPHVLYDHDENNIRKEKEIVSFVRRLQKDLFDKNEECRDLQQRLHEMEEEKNKFASLLTVVGDLEEKLHKLKANNDVRVLKAKIEEQEKIIKEFGNIKFHYDKLAAMLEGATVTTTKKKKSLHTGAIPFHRINHEYSDSSLSSRPAWVSPSSKKAAPDHDHSQRDTLSNEIEKIRHKLLAASYTKYGSDIEKLFKEIDVDHNGAIDMAELEHEIRRLLPDITEKKLHLLMRIADVDGSGMLDLEEFKEFICHRKTLKTYSHHHENEEAKEKKKTIKKKSASKIIKVPTTAGAAEWKQKFYELDDVTRELLNLLKPGARNGDGTILLKAKIDELEEQLSNIMKENDALFETSKLNKEAKERYENELKLMKDSDTDNSSTLKAMEESIQKITKGLGDVFDTSGKVVLMVKPDKASKSSLKVMQDALANGEKEVHALVTESTVPLTLRPLYDILGQLFKDYCVLRSKEYDEESAVQKSQEFAKNAKQMIDKLTNDLSQALKIVNHADMHFIHMASLLHKNQCIAFEDIPEPYQVKAKSPHHKGNLPKRLESHIRERVCSLIRTGVMKLLNNKIISFFEETNDYANRVANSPPPSPTSSRRSTSSSVAPPPFPVAGTKTPERPYEKDFVSTVMSELTNASAGSTHENSADEASPETSPKSKPRKSHSSDDLVHLDADVHSIHHYTDYIDYNIT